MNLKDPGSELTKKKCKERLLKFSASKMSISFEFSSLKKDNIHKDKFMEVAHNK